MSIVHRKLKPVDQNVGDQALHVYRTPETETSRSECRRPCKHFMSIVHRKLKPVDQNVGDQALNVYRTPETETSRSECRRPGTSCLLYTGN
jgi:hypothetical protein